MFAIAVGIAAVVAGGMASVAGFGIGSMLTPLLAARLGTKVAVAAVSIPHVAGTAVRFWRLCGHVDRRIFIWFGITSAAGGLLGALLHASRVLRRVADRSFRTVVAFLLLGLGTRMIVHG
jgi:uncharacterized protein